MADAGFGWGSLVAPAIAASAVVVAKLLERGQRHTTVRELILKDLEIADKLPAGAAKDALVADIERRSQELVNGGSRRRDPSGAFLGVFLVVAGIAMAVAGWYNESPVWRTALWTAAVVTSALGGFGFAQDVSLRERDSKGRPLN